jgi:hypothetical protein
MVFAQTMQGTNPSKTKTKNQKDRKTMKTQIIKDLLEEQSNLQSGKPSDWGYSQDEYDEALENIANELEELGAY